MGRLGGVGQQNVLVSAVRTFAPGWSCRKEGEGELHPGLIKRQCDRSQLLLDPLKA